MMYQGHGNIISSSRSMHSSERESGLILSTDAKPRLKWTPELHERFIEAVHQLGGPDKATPKTIMRLMGIQGLTLYHLKSHLQKFRLSKNLQAQANATNVKNVIGCHLPVPVPMENRPLEGNPVQVKHFIPQPNKSIQISEALQMQIEVQRRLHEQLEVQRHLQMRIEAQGKYLQTVLEKAQETLSKQNPNSSQTGIESAKLQLSELVSKVSDEYLQNNNNNSFQIFEELNGPNNTLQFGDASVDSCLTACEVSQKETQKFKSNEWDSNLLSIGLSTDLDARGKEMDGQDLFLDLNVKDAGHDGGKISRKFDLNGFSWN